MLIWALSALALLLLLGASFLLVDLFVLLLGALPARAKHALTRSFLG